MSLLVYQFFECQNKMNGTILLIHAYTYLETTESDRPIKHITTMKSLTQQLINGSEQAFETIYNQLHREVYSMAYKIVLDSGLSEELVQETFVKVWLYRQSIDLNQNFKNWVITICVRQAKSALRKKALLGKHLQKVIDFFTAGRIGTEHDHEKIGTAGELLSSLSPNHRMVLVLIDLENKSYQEVANILNISIGTVRSRLNRARTTLKEKYERKVKNNET
jgi:RNA polymerase sigma-70 factor, ECF subfamily